MLQPESGMLRRILTPSRQTRSTKCFRVPLTAGSVYIYSDYVQGFAENASGNAHVI